MAPCEISISTSWEVTGYFVRKGWFQNVKVLVKKMNWLIFGMVLQSLVLHSLQSSVLMVLACVEDLEHGPLARS